MMLSSIQIKNFRCFKSLQVKGFKSINLIGGQNNSGKTALLEALLLSFFPSTASVSVLRQFRNENDKLIKTATDKVWNYFFYNQEKEHIIEFTSVFQDGDIRNLELSCTRDIESVLESISTSIGNGKERISDLISSKFSNTLLLNVKGRLLKDDFNYFLLPDKEDSDIGAIGKTPPNFEMPPFLHTSFRLSDNQLSSLFSRAKEQRKISKLNEILSLLDSRIIGSEIDAPGGEPVIKLILNDEQSFPLGMFGDAIRKITELVLVILNTSNSIILIDEIENGIHYTKHKNLWEQLFQIIDNDIQIFATSHSAEMIRAFNEVASSPELESKAMYFEMGRTVTSNKIIINPMNMSILNAEIVTNNSYRGE